MITIVAMIPVLSADASSSEMTFEEFLKEVVDKKGNFDGGGCASLLVAWRNEAEDWSHTEQ